MATAFASSPVRSPRFAWRRHPLLAGMVGLLALALVLRSALFGDPFAGYDEQFYLLTGERMLHGALPYVDIWDRKPPGLFLIYAGIAALPGDGVLAYQLAATASVAATGLVIASIVRRRFADPVAFACAALYVLWTGVMGGEAGQSPLFYNSLVALAALLLLDAVPRIATRAGFARACGAMALCGLALTVKTTVIFEACFFGLTLVAALWRSGAGPARTLAAALAWMAIGALPFSACMAFYAAAGHFDAFWFANATSAALRSDGWRLKSIWWLCLTLAPLGPLALLALAGQRHAGEGAATPQWERRFLAGWLVAATMGFAAVGYFFHHYALPLLVPLTIATARFLARSRHARLALILFAIYPATQQLVINRLLVRDDRADMAAIAAAMPDRVRGECLLVYAGPPILYHLTGACQVSRFAFPDHLHFIGESPAIGVPQTQAVAEALARRPAVIAIDADSYVERHNPATDALVRAALARDYRLRSEHPYRFFEDGKHRLQLWERVR